VQCQNQITDLDHFQNGVGIADNAGGFGQDSLGGVEWRGFPLEDSGGPCVMRILWIQKSDQQPGVSDFFQRWQARIGLRRYWIPYRLESALSDAEKQTALL
jgi:hypothetical protein